LTEAKKARSLRSGDTLLPTEDCHPLTTNTLERIGAMYRIEAQVRGSRATWGWR